MSTAQLGQGQGYVLSVPLATVTTAGSGTDATGTALSGWAGYRQIEVVTAVSLAEGAVATLNVLLDSVIAGSGTWTNLLQSPIYTGTGVYTVRLTRDIATRETGTLIGDAGAGTMRPAGWGASLRIRTSVTGTATTSMSAVVYVSGVM